MELGGRVAKVPEVGLRHRLERLQGEGELIVENGAARIAGPEVGIAQVVEHARAPVVSIDERLITLHRLREMAGRLVGVGFRDSRLCLRPRWRDCREAKCHDPEQ